MSEGYAVRCAAESLARGEAQLATASRVQRWLVVEQPGPWGVEALHESRLAPATAEALDARARAGSVRVLLAREPGQRRLGDVRRVFLAHSGGERWWIERLDLPPDDERALAAIDLDVLASPHPPGVGTPAPEVLHLVCTNGRHDPCCADNGRPVARALAAAGVPDVWESSHVGGDRFAANVVCLPHGTYLGRVPADEAVRIVEDYDRGTIHLAAYRGRSCWPPLVQAAEWFARAHLDERRTDGLRVLSAAGGDAERTVRLRRRGGGELTVRVRRERAAAAVQLTCRSPGPQTPWSYRLVAVTPGRRPGRSGQPPPSGRLRSVGGSGRSDAS